MNGEARNITLQPALELYFEESELAIPPSFSGDTQEERDAGFQSLSCFIGRRLRLGSKLV